MSVDRLARAAGTSLRAATEPVLDITVALDQTLRTSRRRRRNGQLAAIALVVALVVGVFAAVPGLLHDRASTVPATHDQSPAPSPSPTTSTIPAIDTTSWTTYTSDRYSLQVGHPADWTETPAIRRWKADVDVANHMSRAQDAFLSPDGEVRVSVWSAPLDSGTSIETTADIEAWVQAYCRASGNTPCAGIHERAVPLCLEARDCHPGLLVPFKDDVQAFFSGGTYDPQAMTVVAVWRGEADSSVTPYGGAQRLLEGFLSTMGVWTASTPFGARR